ncbi:MAG: hypothetical protein INF43_05170 [Alphaproteobacteria bacterium]|jgi:hypothetical protein|nr:hypothetical protein [Alphaproteobacteria bacterium]
MTTSPAPRTKFTFDTEFFEVVGVGRNVAPVRLPPSNTPSVEDRLQQAYAEGQAAGLAEGQQQAQADLARLQQHLQNTLLALQQSLEAREDQLIKTLLGLVEGSLLTIIGHAGAHYGAEVLEHHLRALLPLAKTDEALTLRLHPAARGYHEKLGLPQANVLGLSLRIVPDTTLGPVDAIMEWHQGGVEARLDDHVTALQTLLAAAGATPLPKPDFTTPTLPPATVAAPNFAPPPPMAAAIPQSTVDDPLSVAERERAQRAAALLGDDELVDALK